MSQLRIDIQNTSGANLGSGPIVSATGWKMTNRLDRAGEFSFQMSLADAQYSYVQPRVLVRAWQLIDGTMTQLGVGIVDSIVEDSNASPSMATVSGANLMRELTWRSVRGLLISETGYDDPEDVHSIELDHSGSGAEQTVPDNAYTDETYFRDNNAATFATISDSQYNWRYVGYSRVYDEIKFVIHTLRSAGGNITRAQYFNGTDWIDLTFADNNFVDGTIGGPGANSFGQQGSITFNAPADWVPLIQNCRITGDPDNNKTEYWIRLNNYGGTGVSLADIRVKAQIETLTGAALIMALAPAGWTLTGYTTTLTAVYLQLGDETILDALIQLATICGEHFRLSGTGTARQIEWIRDDATDSGVVAMRNGDPESILADSSRALISEIHTAHDSYDLVSRVIPFGAGTGTARLDLAQTTRTAPAGYTLSAANNYLKLDATEVTYGQTEKVMVWSNIGGATNASADQVAAADALFDAALYWLSINGTAKLTYALTVYALTASLKPGDTIHIVWLEVVDGVAIRNIDTSLIMLEIASQVDQNGTYSVALTVSNQASFPLTETDAIAKLMGQVRAMGAISQPIALAAVQTGDVAIAVKQTATGFGGFNFG